VLAQAMNRAGAYADNGKAAPPAVHNPDPLFIGIGRRPLGRGGDMSAALGDTQIADPAALFVDPPGLQGSWLEQRAKVAVPQGKGRVDVRRNFHDEHADTMKARRESAPEPVRCGQTHRTGSTLL